MYPSFLFFAFLLIFLDFGVLPSYLLFFYDSTTPFSLLRALSIFVLPLLDLYSAMSKSSFGIVLWVVFTLLLSPRDAGNSLASVSPNHLAPAGIFFLRAAWGPLFLIFHLPVGLCEMRLQVCPVRISLFEVRLCRPSSDTIKGAGPLAHQFCNPT